MVAAAGWQGIGNLKHAAVSRIDTCLHVSLCCILQNRTIPVPLSPCLKRNGVPTDIAAKDPSDPTTGPVRLPITKSQLTVRALSCQMSLMSKDNRTSRHQDMAPACAISLVALCPVGFSAPCKQLAEMLCSFCASAALPFAHTCNI